MIFNFVKNLMQLVDFYWQCVCIKMDSIGIISKFWVQIVYISDIKCEKSFGVEWFVIFRVVFEENKERNLNKIII